MTFRSIIIFLFVLFACNIQCILQETDTYDGFKGNADHLTEPMRQLKQSILGEETDIGKLNTNKLSQKINIKSKTFLTPVLTNRGVIKRQLSTSYQFQQETRANRDRSLQIEEEQAESGNRTNSDTETDDDIIPASFDWRDQKAVTSVKRQGRCGACWAFSTVAFYESDLILNKQYAQTIDLSEQFLITCNNRSHGCLGGFLIESMDYVIERGGLPVEHIMPYRENEDKTEKQICQTKEIQQIEESKVRLSYYKVTDKEFIKELILKQPLNVFACSESLNNYRPNTGDHSSSRTLYCDPRATVKDHNVLLVGYTETEWIIKNQWGEQWGIDGYAYISQQDQNDCCIDYQLHTTGFITPKEECNVLECEVCVEQDSCFQCKEGFYVEINENSLTHGHNEHRCVPCQEDHCKQCYEYYGKCRICQEGYTTYFPQYDCGEERVPFCSFADGQTCYECQEGYILTDVNSCLTAKQWADMLHQRSEKQKSEKDLQKDNSSEQSSDQTSNQNQNGNENVKKSKKNDSFIEGLTVAEIMVLMILIFAVFLLCFIYCKKHKRNSGFKNYEDEVELIEQSQPKKISSSNPKRRRRKHQYINQGATDSNVRIQSAGLNGAENLQEKDI